MPAFYAIALLVAFYAIAIAEILIPSGGLLSVAAVVVALTSIIIGYTYSGTLAMTLTLIYVVTTPLIIGLFIRFWPKTKIGRRMLNRETLEADSAMPEPTTIDGTPLSEFVGRIGIATSHLLPGGEIKIDGHRSGAVSTGLPIDTGTLIWVVRLHSGKLQVRPANEDEIRQWREEAVDLRSSSEPTAPALEPTVILEDSIHSVVTSPLDDIDFDKLAIDDGLGEEWGDERK